MNDVENVFSLLIEFAETASQNEIVTEAQSAQARVTTWLAQVEAEQRQLRAAMLACQAISAVTDYSDVDAIHRARKLAMDAIAEEY